MTTGIETEDGAFERKVRAVLEESLVRSPAHVRSRLNQGRQAALAGTVRPRRSWFARALMPATGAVAAAAVALLLLNAHPTVPAGDATAALDVLDLVTDDDALNLMQDDDQSFYEWAAAQGDNGAASGTAGTGI